MPALVLRQPAAVHELADVLPHLEVALDHPVDQPAHLGLQLRRRVGHHLALEGAPHRLPVEQGADTADPHGLFEEPLPPALHVAEQHLQP